MRSDAFIDILLDPEDEDEADGIAVAKLLEEEMNPPLVVIIDLLMPVELRPDEGRKAEKLKTVVLKKVHKRKNKQTRLILLND